MKSLFFLSFIVFSSLSSAETFFAVDYNQRKVDLDLTAMKASTASILKSEVLKSTLESYESDFSSAFKQQVSECVDTSRVHRNQKLIDRAFELLKDYKKNAEEIDRINDILWNKPDPGYIQNFNIDESCIEVKIKELVNEWVPNALKSKHSNTSYPSFSEEYLDIRLYIEFRKKIYEHFKDPRNYALLQTIFDNVISDYRDFFLNNNYISHSSQIVNSVLNDIGLEMFFRDFLHTPSGSCLSAGIDERSVNFCPSHFYSGDLTPMLAYSIIAHEVAHYFDPCPSAGALVPLQNPQVNYFESYFFANVLSNLKTKYQTQNRVQVLPDYDNFEKWMCADQLRELTPDWFSAQLLKRNASKYKYDLSSFAADWTAFRAEYDKDVDPNDTSFDLHPKSSIRLEMILNVLLNNERY